MISAIRALCLLLLLPLPAHAKDHGQWDGYRLTDEQRAWFKSVTNGAGDKCCDVRRLSGGLRNAPG
jgi:hypothetical protein